MEGLNEDIEGQNLSKHRYKKNTLSQAAKEGDASAVELLLRSTEIDPNVRDEEGRTPLSVAALHGHEKIVKVLLQNDKVDPDSRDDRGRTPLSHAALSGHEAVVRLFLDDERVDPNLKDTTGNNPFSRVVRDGTRPIVIAKMLLESGKFNLDPKDGDDSPLWSVVLRGDRALMRMLLEAAQFEFKKRDASFGQQLLMTTVELDRKRILEALLKCSQADPNFEEEEGMTPLVCAMEHEYHGVDDEYTRKEVESMGDIYSGAYMTIIAAKTSGRLNTRKVKRRESILGKSLVQTLYERLLMSKWATRGWTFQEQMLSIRSVIFVEGETFWDCQECTWSGDDLTPESHPNKALVRPYYEAARRMATISWPDFAMYIEIVGLYNSRDLTYPQDALPAISGVLNTLTRTFPSGFLCGLPRMFLDAALLWQPFSKAERRVAKDGAAIAPNQHLPSWSWCGWHCPIDPFNLRCMTPYVNEGTGEVQLSTWKTHSLVQWYVLSEDMQHRSWINPWGAIGSQDSMVYNNSTLAKEWSQKDSKHTSEAFAHVQNLSHDNAGITTYTTLQNTWPYLSCLTTRTFLRIKTLLKADRERASDYQLLIMRLPIFQLPRFSTVSELKDICHLISLEDKHKASAGVLRLMDRAEVKPGDTIELVAISTGTIKARDLGNKELGWMFNHTRKSETDGTWSSELRELRKEVLQYGVEKSGYKKPPDRLKEPHTRLEDSDLEYNFYNVLWIERKGEIAYRRAAGRVPEVIWEANCTEPSQLILG
ncbi:hypothetical protein HBI24_137790 [Parastagonospora nodorum]|nr:hypothetical protein HBH45_013970 [Parastagonospora nodorum]KAH4328349.1 hypothetical protein HBI00_112000 [Parastagonospora nodorum]KAH4387987.1 hypothetical protein HBH94_028780 [Parastagonospora nodorum]KAH4459921.1 hypothetical protein HBH91_064660 [Parastagonospora nodorum]KAH4475631.1 hypothetical protein HBH90_013170 [Parastagonospora nodorum]